MVPLNCIVTVNDTFYPEGDPVEIVAWDRVDLALATQAVDQDHQPSLHLPVLFRRALEWTGQVTSDGGPWQVRSDRTSFKL